MMDRSENTWIRLGDREEQVVSWGETPGEYRPARVPVPPVQDEGIVLRLICSGGLRGGLLGDLASGAVWEVLSVQEKSKFVLGQRVWLNPTPSCGICPACQAGCHSNCQDSSRQTAFPGWMSDIRVLHPWAVRRGILSIPSTVAPELFSLLVPMSRAMRIRRTIVRRDRVLVIGSGIPALLVGAALEGPGRRVLVDPASTLERFGSFGFHHCGPKLEPMLDALQGEPDLVVLVGGDSAWLQSAIQSAGLGATILSMVPLDRIERFPELWEKQITWISQRGFSPEDLVPARNRLVEMAQFLEELPRTRLRMEELSGHRTFESLWTVVESCAPSY